MQPLRNEIEFSNHNKICSKVYTPFLFRFMNNMTDYGLFIRVQSIILAEIKDELSKTSN